MAIGISLTSGMRSNLTALQQTVTLINQTQERLSSGKKVNSAIDNPTSYFAAQSLNSRATDLAALKDNMGQAIQTIQAANAGITAITTLVDAAKGLAQSALATTDTTSRAGYAAQFDAIRAQIDRLAADSGYKGTNLINGNDLTVTFNETATSTFGITAANLTSVGLGILAATNSWAAAVDINAAVTNLNSATTTLRDKSAALSSGLSVITARQGFTDAMVNTLNTGADNLTLADMNQEGANMLMLQTRQSLSTTALSLSSQAAQSVLRLFA